MAVTLLVSWRREFATNLSKSDFRRRLLEDYGTRQVVFEIKNFAGLEPDEYIVHH